MNEVNRDRGWRQNLGGEVVDDAASVGGVERGYPDFQLRKPDPLLRIDQRVAIQVAQLIESQEEEALEWIESVSEFDTSRP